MEVARHWRLKAQRYRLEGSACPSCGQLLFPPRPMCPEGCGQPAASNDGALAMPASIGVADLQLHRRRQVAERLIG